MPKELPEMDTGKEVHVQNGEEHVASNSMAAFEINGDVGIEKQGEELEEGTHPAAIGTAAGASYLHPLVLEESESDSEDQAWTNHPPSSPNGSLLHAMYFQLLGAGFDGMLVLELFRSRVHTWRKAFKKPVAALAEPEMEFDGMTVRELFRSRVHARRKAFKKPVAALAEPSMEFEEMHRSMGDMQMPSRVGNPDDGSNGEQLEQQRLESVPRSHHVAGKKTDANVGSFKSQGQIRTRTTRPLPPHLGVRKNTPMKKNKGYLKNRLQGRSAEQGEEASLHSQVSIPKEDDSSGDISTVFSRN